MSKKKNRKSKNKKITFSINELISMVLLLITLGIFIGSIFTYDRESIVVQNTSEELNEFIDTYNNIYHNYYKKISKKELLDKAIEGMVNSLEDPYSTFMDKESSMEFNKKVDSEYTGIGITIKLENEKVNIISLFKNSPAKKAGIKVGDEILSINEKSLKNKSIDEISNLIKSSKKKIILKLLRNEKEYIYKLKKDNVDIPTVSSKIINYNDKKIGYMSISIFASNTYKEFSAELKKIENKKFDSLIIDVRNNPGGHLDQVTQILDKFLDKKKVLYQISTKENKKIYSSTKENRKYNIAVLINKNSASASEILAAAIKESYKGKIIGTNSYGKGSVQKQYKLSSGSSIKYTVKKWLTPNGNSIDNVGVQPDVLIELNDEYYVNQTEENDNQLQKSLEILK